MASNDSLKKKIDIPPHVIKQLRDKGFQTDENGVVTWEKNSRKHPRHWPLMRKIYDSAIIIFLEFFVTLISNTGSSIANGAHDALDISHMTALILFTTTYMMGQAIGGLIFPPVCESFGGRTVYVTSTFGYAIACGMIAFWPAPWMIGLGRFVSGAMSAMPAVVATGSIENMWDVRARIWLIHLWIAGAVIGLALGPPVATFVGAEYGWPWLLYGAAGVGFVCALLCLGMQESRPQQLLRHHVKRISRKTSCSDLSIDEKDSRPSLKQFVREDLFLPVKLFFTEPIVFFTSLMAATVFGFTYLFSESLGIVYMEGFGMDEKQASLVFLSIGVGVAFSFLPRIYDIHITNRRRRENRVIEPEDKLFGFYIASPALAIGLWWFGSTVPPMIINVTAWASIASLALFGFAVVEFDCVLSGYLTDVYATHAASANAPMAFLRATMSGTFPLFGTQLFSGLGANRAIFIIAALATAYCAVALWFGLNGKKIREKSRFAEKTWAVAQEEQIEASDGRAVAAAAVADPEKRGTVNANDPRTWV